MNPPVPAPFSMASDHHFPAHPLILKSLVEASDGVYPSYEGDIFSQKAKGILGEIFKAEDVLFVFNGTAANVLSLKLYLPPASSVLCTDISHLFNDEAGAPEALAQAKLIPVPHENGKLTPERLKRHLHRQRDQHFAPVQMISITQPTELGTVYQLAEIQAIKEICTEYQLKLHVDGARLGQAAAFLKTDLGQATGLADVVSLGGTKNGLVFGEAVILRTAPLYPHPAKIRKQLLQLPSKSRYIGAQFLAYLQNDLWREIADQSHLAAKELEKGLRDLGFEPHYPVESNAVFISLNPSVRSPLRKKYFFYVWDPESEMIRLMTSFHESSGVLRDFLSDLREKLN